MSKLRGNKVSQIHLAAINVAHELVTQNHVVCNLQDVAEVGLLQLHRKLEVERHQRLLNLLELISLEHRQREENGAPDVPTKRQLFDVRHDSLEQSLRKIIFN